MGKQDEFDNLVPHFSMSLLIGKSFCISKCDIDILEEGSMRPAFLIRMDDDDDEGGFSNIEFSYWDDDLINRTGHLMRYILLVQTKLGYAIQMTATTKSRIELVWGELFKGE